MVSPTNAIGPAAAVAAPHSSTTATARERAGEPDPLAERAGHVVAERQRVEQPTAAERHDRADDDERRDLRGDVGVAPGERTDGPEAELVERGDVEQQDRRR